MELAAQSFPQSNLCLHKAAGWSPLPKSQQSAVTLEKLEVAVLNEPLCYSGTLHKSSALIFWVSNRARRKAEGSQTLLSTLGAPGHKFVMG